jgi:hypothetical protein
MNEKFGSKICQVQHNTWIRNHLQVEVVLWQNTNLGCSKISSAVGASPASVLMLVHERKIDSDPSKTIGYSLSMSGARYPSFISASKVFLISLQPVLEEIER